MLEVIFIPNPPLLLPPLPLCPLLPLPSPPPPATAPPPRRYQDRHDELS